MPACGHLLNLASVSTENLYEIPEGVQIHILADVVSPLCGPQGATYTFGKQKGLQPTMFAVVDQAIQDFYKKFHQQHCKLKEQELVEALLLVCVPLLRQISCRELIPA